MVPWRFVPTVLVETKETSEVSEMKYVVTLLLGVAALFTTTMALGAADEANKARVAAEQGAATHTDHVESGVAGTATQSFAGQTAEDAEAIAAEREPFPAELPAAPEGDVAEVNLVVVDKAVEIAPGVRYNVWAWGYDAESATALGPPIHVREGQLVKFTITNEGSIPHSMDFHAARIAPNEAFKDVMPGESFSFEFVAGDPGVYMYHCGTKPVLAHIANGMYGAIVVSPSDLPPADEEYVLVSSEWYLDSPGIDEPANLSMDKARAMTPDWVTWNGYAGQYAQHPLTADPGDTVRFWVVAAGPSLGTDFHVVGTVFDRAWANAAMHDPQVGPQTVHVPAGGGGVFDVKIDEPGTYPVVSHSFASVELGQVGILKVGEPKGGASH
jgi:nitrite reductase (NO-forming)